MKSPCRYAQQYIAHVTSSAQTAATETDCMLAGMAVTFAAVIATLGVTIRASF
jgi:hypothetical protein